jgi:hypothetical protein
VNMQTLPAPATLVFDMMSPRGHVRLNKFYLSKVFAEHCRFFISNDLSAEYEGFDVYPLGEKPCGSSLFERFSLAFRVLRIVRNQNARSVVFVSYDLATFPLLSNSLHRMGIKLASFEHNTAPTSGLRGMFQRLGASNVRRFVYTPYLMELYQSNGIKAEYVPHPCIPCEIQPEGSHEWASIVAERSRGYTKTGFCPSGSVTVNQMEEIARLYPDFLFVIKSKETSCLANVLSAPYFEYYGNAMQQCDFVVIPFASNRKVSGPVFEAIAMGKPVLVLNNRFGNYIKSMFPEQIFFSGAHVPENVATVDCTLHNMEIARRVRETLSQ